MRKLVCAKKRASVTASAGRMGARSVASVASRMASTAARRTAERNTGASRVSCEAAEPWHTACQPAWLIAHCGADRASRELVDAAVGELEDDQRQARRGADDRDGV